MTTTLPMMFFNQGGASCNIFKNFSKAAIPASNIPDSVKLLPASVKNSLIPLDIASALAWIVL